MKSFLLILLLICYGLTATAQYVVINTLDSGPGSLREAVTSANSTLGPNTITFNIPIADPNHNAGAGIWTIQPNTSLPTITEELDIDASTQPGTTNRRVVIDGQNSTSLLSVNTVGSDKVSILGMQLINGSSTSAGAAIEIINCSAIDITNCLFENNQTTSDGGAIADLGTSQIDLSESDFISNTAAGSGGAIVDYGGGGIDAVKTNFVNNVANGGSGGAINNDYTAAYISYYIIQCSFVNNSSTGNGGALTINNSSHSVWNSTFSGNSAGLNGGAIYSDGMLQGIDVRYATIYQNTASSGGGIYMEEGAIQFRNSVLAANIGGEYGQNNGFINSLGSNFVSLDPSSLFTNAGDISDVSTPLDPQLAALGFNGLTYFHAPILGSQLIDAGMVDAFVTDDQTGLARPQDGIEDIGAIEYLLVEIGGVIDSDYNALIALYNATDGPNWINRTNWLTAADVSTWFGVVTSGNRVQQVNLNDNNLVGTLPPEIGLLNSTIYFRVRGNTISGVIPVETGTMSSIIQLWLYDNQLTGTIPVELADITTLRELRLDQNQLTGTIPTELGNLPNLWLLFLYSNQLTGSIPITSANFPGLRAIDVNNNQLSGPIPLALGDHPNIDYLLMGNNQLTGTIPPVLGNLTGLNYLQLHSNLLTGAIPIELGSFPNLIQLYLYNNQLTGSIPTELGNLSNLEQFLLNQNQLSGSIPPELGNLSSVLRFRLHTNQLTGSIPTDLGNLSTVQELELSRNQLSGNIPSSLGSLSNLTYLGLFINQLNGSVPTELGDLSSLQTFRLETNLLTGTIPSSLGNMTLVTDFRLADNQLSGPIPGELGNLSSLQVLGLYQNQLTGSIPTELGNLSNLESLNCFGNQLDGTVPSELTNLTLLTQLRLNDNLLINLTDLSSLTNLTQFTIDNNLFHFDDIEPNVSVSGVVYSPQSNLPSPGDQTLSEGSTLDITISVGGSANIYSWLKDGNSLPAQSSNNLLISNITSTNAGQYNLVITSTAVPGLTLQSEVFNLTVTAAPPEQVTIFKGTDSSGNPISIGQTDIDLGTTVVGTDIDSDFAIQNNEASVVTISSISSSDPVFEIINTPSDVQPGATENFTVRLISEAEGQFTSTITVNSDFSPFNFTVIGTVVPDNPSASIIVYNAVSPNGDGKHDFLEMQNIELFPNNQVKIMSRWGEVIYEVKGYDNVNNKFVGVGKDGGELPTGTYYYIISLGDGSEDINGFFSLRR